MDDAIRYLVIALGAALEKYGTYPVDAADEVANAAQDLIDALEEQDE